MGSVNFRTSEQEDEVIATRMLLAGDKNKTEHFRRIYFGNVEQGAAALGEVRAELRELAKSVDDLRRLVTRMAENAGGDVEQRMLAALFLMVFPSVDPGIQAEIGRHMDKGVIEKFLAGTSRRVR